MKEGFDVNFNSCFSIDIRDKPYIDSFAKIFHYFTKDGVVHEFAKVFFERVLCFGSFFPY